MKNSFNVLQAMLGLVWGTWFSLTGIAVLSSNELREFPPFLTSETLPLIKLIISIFLVVSVFAIAVLLRTYQLINDTHLDIRVHKNEKLIRLYRSMAKGFIIILTVNLLIIWPGLSISLFRDVNPYQAILSSAFLIIIFLYYYIDGKLPEIFINGPS